MLPAREDALLAAGQEARAGWPSSTSPTQVIEAARSASARRSGGTHTHSS